ncbi:MAG: oxidoreductase [Actinomycetes bacterium]
MGLFGRKKPSVSAPAPSQRSAQAETVKHFKEFVARNEECEAFIEPATRVTQTTMVIVAGTGEWTRRKVPDAKAAEKLAKELKIPVFDVNLSGYPSRMREWSAKHRKL